MLHWLTGWLVEHRPLSRVLPVHSSTRRVDPGDAALLPLGRAGGADVFEALRACLCDTDSAAAGEAAAEAQGLRRTPSGLRLRQHAVLLGERQRLLERWAPLRSVRLVALHGRKHSKRSRVDGVGVGKDRLHTLQLVERRNFSFFRSWNWRAWREQLR